MSDFVPKSSSEASYQRWAGSPRWSRIPINARSSRSTRARRWSGPASISSNSLEGLVERLGSLGYDELTVLAKHAAELRKHGFYGEFPDGVRLEFF